MKPVNTQSGFTLLETLLSLALTALIIGMLSVISRQWLMDWRMGFNRVEELDHLELAKDRMATDMRSALNLPIVASAIGPRFTGDASRIMFVREPFSSDKTSRLVAVEYMSDPDLGIIRRTAVYDKSLPLEKMRFGEPVTVFPSPYKAVFSYRDAEGQTTQTWQIPIPPKAISIAISDADNKVAWTFPIAIDATVPATCSTANSLKQCRQMIRRSAQPDIEPKVTGNPMILNKGPVAP